MEGERTEKWRLKMSEDDGGRELKWARSYSFFFFLNILIFKYKTMLF